MKSKTKNKLIETGADVSRLIGSLHYEGVDEYRLKEAVQVLARQLNQVILLLIVEESND